MYILGFLTNEVAAFQQLIQALGFFNKRTVTSEFWLLSLISEFWLKSQNCNFYCLFYRSSYAFVRFVIYKYLLVQCFFIFINIICHKYHIYIFILYKKIIKIKSIARNAHFLFRSNREAETLFCLKCYILSFLENTLSNKIHIHVAT